MCNKDFTYLQLVETQLIEYLILDQPDDASFGVSFLDGNRVQFPVGLGSGRDRLGMGFSQFLHHTILGVVGAEVHKLCKHLQIFP